MGLIIVLIVALSVPPAAAQRMEPAPKQLKEVEIEEHPGVQVPLDLPFVDSNRRDVLLGDLFDGKRPVLLTLNYSDCPMLCSLQLNGLFEGLKEMKWDMGDEYQMVTVSIDPTELPERAQLTKQKYLRILNRPGAAGGWHCLTGEEPNIRRLANTVGFGYSYIEVTREYAHAAVTMVLTPDGRVSRYLYGVEYDPQTLRLSLVEAAEGKVGSTLDQIILFCFHYDETEGRYAPAAQAIMRVGAGLTVLCIGGILLVFRRREKQRGKESETEVTEAKQMESSA